MWQQRITVGSEGDSGPPPKLGKLLLLDGKKRYIITDVTDEDGIYSFELEAATT